MTNGECSSCRWFKPIEDEDEGECRRYAPRPKLGGDGPWDTYWPDVWPKDWCGEFTAKVEAKLCDGWVDLSGCTCPNCRAMRAADAAVSAAREATETVPFTDNSGAIIGWHTRPKIEKDQK